MVIQSGRKNLDKVHSVSVEPFYDERTSTLTYCVYDRVSRDAVVIDPVLDYDAASSTVWTESVDKILTFVDTRQLILQLVLETHAHADHLSGAQEIKRRGRCLYWPRHHDCSADVQIGIRYAGRISCGRFTV